MSARIEIYEVGDHHILLKSCGRGWQLEDSLSRAIENVQTSGWDSTKDRELLKLVCPHQLTEWE